MSRPGVGGDAHARRNIWAKHLGEATRRQATVSAGEASNVGIRAWGRPVGRVSGVAGDEQDIRSERGIVLIRLEARASRTELCNPSSDNTGPPVDAGCA